MRRAAQPRLSAAGVTEREAETLAAVGRRLTNSEIAGEMVISVRTVESHVSSLLRKLGLPGRPALVELARQLARPGPRAARALHQPGRQGRRARRPGQAAP